MSDEYTLQDWVNIAPQKFDKTEVFKTELLQKVEELREICGQLGIPCYMMFGVADDGERYSTEIFHTAKGLEFVSVDQIIVQTLMAVEPQEMVRKLLMVQASYYEKMYLAEKPRH